MKRAQGRKRRSRLPGLRAILALTVLASLLAGGRLAAQETVPQAAEAEVVTAPVALDGTVLFRVRGVSSYPAAVRARLIRNQLTAVASNEAIPVDSIHAVEADGMTRVVAGTLPIVTVVEADASLEQVGRVELATVHVTRIREAVVAYRAARTPAALRATAVTFLVATAVLVLVVFGFSWFWRRVDRLLRRFLEARIHSVEIQSFEVMRAERIWSALSSALLAFRTLVILGVVLVYVGYSLALFPWSRGISQDMVGFALAPGRVILLGFVEHIPSLAFLLVLFVFVRVALRMVRLFFDAVGQGSVALHGFDPEWAQPTYKIVRVVVVAFALIVAFPYIPGSNTDAFRGVSIFIGVIFSLGSSSAISNIIAGYMLTYRRALKVGDRVKIGDAFGDVIETRLQVTHLRSIKNEEIIIPNSQILGAEVFNYSSLSRTQGLILHTEVGIGYETPWRQVEAMLLESAARTEGISTEPPPFILQKKLGDFAVTYEINGYCTNVQRMGRVYTDLHRNILDVFNEYGVQIMTPAYEGDPPEPKVVARKDWYTAPARPAPAQPPASGQSDAS